MTDDNDRKDRPSLGLSPAQVTGSALAAMSGAFLASWLGTTGTLVGAAVGSVVATVGAAIYTHSLRRTSLVVKRTAVQVRHAPLLTGATPRPDTREVASDAPVPDPNAPRPGEVRTEHTSVEEEARPGRFASFFAGGLDLPWVKVALASLAVLVVALGGITAVEAITGKPLAALLGRDGGSGTTVGHVVGADHSSTHQHQSPKKRAPATQQPAPSSTPTPSQQPQPPQQAPSTPPTPQPSTPVPSLRPSQSPSPNSTLP